MVLLAHDSACSTFYCEYTVLSALTLDTHENLLPQLVLFVLASRVLQIEAKVAMVLVDQQNRNLVGRIVACLFADLMVFVVTRTPTIGSRLTGYQASTGTTDSLLWCM